MGYVLTRNQEGFIEDVQDWMNSQIIESQNSSILEDGQSGMGSPSIGNTQTTSGIMNIFIEKISDFSKQMEDSNKANESMFGMLTNSIDNNSLSATNEMNVLETISSSLKELNINQFSNSSTMGESLQEISDTGMIQNNSIKQMIELQDKNNQLLEKLVDNLDARLTKIEKQISK